MINQTDLTVWSGLAANFAAEKKGTMACRATEAAKNVADTRYQDMKPYLNDPKFAAFARSNAKLTGTIDGLIEMCRGKFGQQDPLTVSDL